MITLALCDDEPAQRSLLSELLKKFMENRPLLALRFSVFSSSSALLSRVKGGESFDIYLLDIIMPELSGISLGTKLRELEQDGLIIYLTSSREFAVESYQARAFNYLLKPVEPEQLYQVLDQAVSLLERRRSACITVKTRNGLQRLPLDRILFAELAGRSLRYHMVSGESVDSVTLRGPFQEAAAPLLADSRFCQCGSSFIVNLHYVVAVNKSYLQLDSGVRVPLTRSYAAGAKQRWQDYWLEGGHQA